MKISSDGTYKLYPDCANEATTGATVAVWDISTKQPHPDYPDTAQFLQQYGAEIPQPEPTPEPETQPNWAEFRSQIGSHLAYLRMASGHPHNLVLNTQLTALLWRVGDDSSLFPEVAQHWAQMVANVPLTAIEIAQLNAIATACNMPLHLDAEGRMGVG